jgi:hypothetical protein
MPEYGLGALPDPVDERDFLLEAILPAVVDVALPEVWSVPRHSVRNQGPRGTCVAVSGSMGDQFVHGSGDLSEEWLWHRCKEADGLPEADGTYPRAMLDTLLKRGCPEERFLPYNTFLDVLPGADENAAKYKIGSYAAVATDYDSIRRARFVNGPVFLALNIHDSFKQTGPDGIVAMPSGTLRGGHLVCADGGWDARGLEVANTWGQWADRGYFHIGAEPLRAIIIAAWSIVDETLVECPWSDWGDDERVAANVVWKAGIMLGYPDGTFHPWQQVTRRAVGLVAMRLTLPYMNEWLEDYTPATREWAAAAIPQFKWTVIDQTGPLLRRHLALLAARELQGR